MKITKRIISGALAVCLLLSLVPAVSFAENTVVYEATFESGTDGFASAGDTAVVNSDEQSNSGKYSMKVSGAAADWHGA